MNHTDSLHKFGGPLRTGSFAAAVATAVVLGASARAGSIPVANGSFESPSTAFVDTRVDNWTKSAQPAFFDPAQAGITWDQLSGVFANTPPGSPSHIDNVTGNQAVYMFAIPSVGLSQQLSDTFQVGASYDLTVGVVGGGGGMPVGTSFMIGMYYLDGSNNPVPMASTYFSYDVGTFPATTHLSDFTAHLDVLQAGDASIGKSIGVSLTAISGTGAGYWDLDNVRLESSAVSAVPEPGILALAGVGAGALLLARRRGFRKS